MRNIYIYIYIQENAFSYNTTGFASWLMVMKCKAKNTSRHETFVLYKPSNV